MALEKLVKDIREEKILWCKNLEKTIDIENEAWARVAKKNKLTAASEAKLIFRELWKKYLIESKKPESGWRLLTHLKFLEENDQEKKEKEKSQSAENSLEEDVYVELLEVKEEEFSDDETPPKDNAAEDTANKPSKDECSSTTQEVKQIITTTNSIKRKPEEDIDRPNGTNGDISPPIKRMNIKKEPNDLIDQPTESNNLENITKTEKSTSTQSGRSYDRFGCYVAQTLNDLPRHLAAHLEIKILEAIIATNSQAMENFNNV